MRNRMMRYLASAMLVLPAGGCLVQALMNPEIAQPRIMEIVNAHPVLAGTWVNWAVDRVDELTADE